MVKRKENKHMNKFSKIVIALNILFGLAFVATVIYANSIRLFFTTGISLLVSSTMFVCCVTYDYIKNYRRSTTKTAEQTPHKGAYLYIYI